MEKLCPPSMEEGIFDLHFQPRTRKEPPHPSLLHDTDDDFRTREMPGKDDKRSSHRTHCTIETLQCLIDGSANVAGK